MIRNLTSILALIVGLSFNLEAQDIYQKDFLGQQIELLAKDKEMTKQDKFFTLTDIYLLAVKEALSADTDKELVRRINVFEYKNKQYLDLLFFELDNWQRTLTEAQRQKFNVAFIMRKESEDFFTYMMQVRNRVGEHNEVVLKKFDKLYPLSY